ncbi:MAG TPA: MarR family winged helix-turn-helix transcriptional regulator [Candidatus Saccharimonadia bacterium]
MLEHANNVAQVCYYLKQINLAYTRLMDQRLADLGLTQAQGEVLFMLWQNPDLSQGQLRQQLGVTAPTLSGLIDTLAYKGLIERQANPADPRRNNLVLTDRAQMLRNGYMEIKATVTNAFATGLSEAELQLLSQWLKQLNHNLVDITTQNSR